MNTLIELRQQLLLGKNKDEVNLVRNLCMVMEKVGGYEQLQELPLPAFNEIFKYLQWAEKEQNKRIKGRRR